ncbi:MAG: hypothetical protein R3E48_15800 [Burkholderiaceae bacterium]
MSGLDREGHPAIPLQRCAGVVGHRALAAQFVQAPALARTGVVEALGEQAAFVERAAVATVMDALAEEGAWATECIELGQLAEREDVRDRAGHRLRQGRAAGDVDHRLVADQLGDRDRAGGIGIRFGQAAEGCAGTDRHHGGRMLDRLGQHGQIGLAGDHRVDATVGGGYRAVDDDDVLALVLRHRLAARGLGGVARDGLQRVVVVERDEIEDQVLEAGAERARQRFGAAGAFLERQPDHRLPARLGQAVGHGRRRRRRQGHQRAQVAGVLQERTARHAARGEDLAEHLSHWRTP